MVSYLEKLKDLKPQISQRIQICQEKSRSSQNSNKTKLQDQDQARIQTKMLLPE
jgi:uncharacterized spore protein YtfJ